MIAYPQKQAEVFKVEPAGRYLLDPKGKPFFWLGTQLGSSATGHVVKTSSFTCRLAPSKVLR